MRKKKSEHKTRNTHLVAVVEWEVNKSAATKTTGLQLTHENLMIPPLRNPHSLV